MSKHILSILILTALLFTLFLIPSLAVDDLPTTDSVPAEAEASASSEADAQVFYLTEGEYEEFMTTLGNIYGILIFFTVVVLCWFVYKFFRMFF